MQLPLILLPFERLESRPFTHREHGERDLAALRLMRESLRQVLGPAGPRLEGAPFYTLNTTQSDGHTLRAQRIVLARPEVLRTAADVFVVGFFGQRRPEADAAPLTAVDDELIGEFAQHPEVLSYSSLELGGGDWGNLVLLRDAVGSEHWRTSERHAYAVRELAPGYYRSIRLHNGLLPGGVLSSGDIALARTKYYAFEAGTAWLGVRELG